MKFDATARRRAQTKKRVVNPVKELGRHKVAKGRLWKPCTPFHKQLQVG